MSSSAATLPARRVARQFEWGPVDVSAVDRGHVNDSYFVASPSGDYVLQRLNGTVFTDPAATVANMLILHRHLGGALTPVPVPAPRGGWLVHDRGEVWRAFQRVAGAVPCPGPGAATAGESGALLGRFHAGLADLDPSHLAVTLPNFHDPRRRLDALRREACSDRLDRSGAATAEIEQVLAVAGLVEIADDLSHRVPVRAAHFDAKQDNILFRGSEAVCLVDLDTVMPGPWFWDVGDLLRSAATPAAEDCPDPSVAVVDPVLYDAVLEGYAASLPPGLLEPAERQALEVAGAIATFEQVVRFLTDWLAGDTYFRTTRPGQNLDRARNQLALLSTMPGSVP